jgi:GGDEF domain-containing protein
MSSDQLKRPLGAPDSVAALRDPAISDRDGLFRWRHRAGGLDELQHEIDKARLSTGQLVAVIVDVDGLRRTTGNRGHFSGYDLSGYAVFRLIADSLKGHMRPHDVILRLGGDQCVCAVPNETLEKVRERFQAIADQLVREPIRRSITIGCAELIPGEPREQLLERVNADLTARRRPHAHNDDSAALAPARSVRRATARRASSRRATARSRQVEVTPRMIDFLAQHPGSTAGDVARALSLKPGNAATRLTQLTKAGKIDRAARGFSAK